MVDRTVFIRSPMPQARGGADKVALMFAYEPRGKLNSPPMNMKTRKLATLLTAALALGGAASTRSVSQPASLNAIESAYADFNDASGAISLIESGLRDSYQGRTRSEWAPPATAGT